MRKILIIILLATTLQSCIFVAGAAAGAASAVVVYDHRKIARIAQDQHITAQVVQELDRIPGIRENAHINVTVFNKIVLLTGEAVTTRIHDQAGSMANAVPGVERVYNEIAIMGPSSSLSRTSDSWITAKIRTQMIANKELKSSSIKVVTENGVVYLMGNVSREQADIAVDIARQVTGVQRVIKIFQYNAGNVQPSPANTSSNDSQPNLSENTAPTDQSTVTTTAANTPLPAVPNETNVENTAVADDAATKLLAQQNNDSNNVVYSN